MLIKIGKSDDRPPWAPLKVWLDGQLLTADRSLKVANKSPDGFQVGYYGSAPNQLSLAILLEVLNNESVAYQLMTEFTRQFVAEWHEETTYSIDVLAWVHREMFGEKDNA